MDRRHALRLLGFPALALLARGIAHGAGTAAPEGPPMTSSTAAAPLLTRAIPSSGEALPVLGLGTWQTFDVGASREERAPLEEVLRLFVGLGGRLVDSSPMYGRSEEVAGALAEAAGLRTRLFLATKVWTSGRAEGIRQMEASFKKLRAGKLDLMQVHNLVDAETHLGTLSEWRKEGRIRYLGVTHYAASAHGEVAKVLAAHPLDFVQINYSVGEREADARLLDLARDKGVAVIANRPFAGGGLLRRLKARPLPGFASELGCATWPQLLLKFVIGHPAITCAIPATSKAAHLEENMAAGRGPLPDPDLRERIAGASA